MAFPSIRSRTSTNGTTATASPILNLPNPIRAGDTLIVYFKSAVAGAVGFPAGWNELVDASPDASVGQIAIAWKKADGTESGSITCSAGNGKFCSVSRVIRDAADPTIRPPEISAVATGSATEPNPNSLTPTGGAKDYLWDTVYFMEGEQTGVTAYPANYTVEQIFANSGTGGAVTTNATCAVGSRQLNATSEDAGVWDVTGTLDDWSAYTVAFHPAEAVPAPLQTDYERPNPLPLKTIGMAGLTIAVNLLQSTLTPADIPFAQHNWPLPQQKGSIYVTIDTLPGEAIVVNPFFQTEWPNPRYPGRQTLTFTGNLLQSTLTPEVEEAPFFQTDWPLPRRQAPQTLSWTLGLQTSTLPSVPHNQYDWPLPRRKGPSPTGITLGLQTSTLPSIPFNQYDWPLPLRQKKTALTWLQDRKQYYVDEMLVGTASFPQPGARRGVIGAFVQNLLLTTLARPVGSIEIGTHPQRDISTLTWTQNLLESTLSVVEAAPFVPMAWPNPRVMPARTHTWTQDRKFYYEDARLVAQWDWPLPVRYRRQTLSWTSQNLLQTVLKPEDAPKPFAQIDWPLPQHKRRNAVGFTQDRKQYYVDIKPFLQTEWPTPPRKRAGQQFVASSPTVLLVGTPFAQHNWPLPQRKKAGQHFIAGSPTVVGTPFAQYDWPLPQRKIVPAKTWVGGTLGLMLDIAPPVPTYDWPLPRRKAPQTLTWTQDRKFYYEDIQPFAQYEWPVPAPKRVARDIFTWAMAPTIIPPFTDIPVIDFVVQIALAVDGGTVEIAKAVSADVRVDKAFTTEETR